MSVTNGQIANQTTFNDSFVSKTTASTMAEPLTAEKQHILKQIATPAEPAAGHTAVYTKSDGKLYRFAEGQTEIEIGGGGGGSGGGSLTWREGSPSPEKIIEGNVDVYAYSLADAGSQALYAIVKVPSSYIAGNQISLKMPVYSIDDTGTFLLSTVATLIRVGTDAYSSTTNQRTSTNTAITSTAGNQYKPQAVTFDLTSSIGQINAVAVSAGDYINVKLIRGSDTNVDPVRAITFGAEAVFQ